MVTENGSPHLRLGSWGRSGTFVGLVAAVDDGEVTLFAPGDRQQAVVPRREVEPVPAAAVTVRLTVELPLAHGLDETSLRRWIATLADPVLTERAADALRATGLDEGAALPGPRLDVQPASSSGALCLCGARTPAPPGASPACSRCGRQAYSAPA